MRIDFDDEEYPELSRYLENPKRKMKFLYFLEELFETNSFDPAIDGLGVLNRARRGTLNTDQSELTSYLENIASALATLSKNMEGSVIGRFPVEHVVHETVAPAPQPKVSGKYEDDEIDYSSTDGIDFSAAIAAFEE